MGVTLSLAKFNRILAIDPASRTARVQCGVRNLAISEAAAPYGLYYAPDPAARSPAPSAATWPRTRAACTA
jgi:glycolate oxidase